MICLGTLRAPTFRNEMRFESIGVKRMNGGNWLQVRSWVWFYRSSNMFIMKLSKFSSVTLNAYLCMCYIISLMYKVHILLKNVPSGYVESLTNSHDPYCYQAGPLVHLSSNWFFCFSLCFLFPGLFSYYSLDHIFSVLLVVWSDPTLRS